MELCDLSFIPLTRQADKGTQQPPNSQQARMIVIGQRMAWAGTSGKTQGNSHDNL
jgi:hypothetical protein